MKRILSFLLAAVIVLILPVAATAAREPRGFTTIGNFSGSKVSFGFEPDYTVTVYNKEVEDDPDYEEIWPGMDIYVPVYILGASGQNNTHASEKDIKSNEVSLSWKSKTGERYIDDVTLVDGKKAKIAGLDGGMYAKISMVSEYSSRSAMPVYVDLVLSVNRLSYPETLTTLKLDIVNREVNIDRDTVYAAQSPTQFYSMRHYAGKATFDFGDKVTYNATVEKGARYYLHLDRTEDEAFAAMYPDAYLEYYNFRGDRDSFPSTGTLNVPVKRANFTPKGEDKAQVFVYEVQDGNLKALDERVLDFDGKKNILTIRAKSLGYYILSDRALHKEVDHRDEDIIYTGYASQNAGTADDMPTEETGGGGSGGSGSSSGVNENPETGGDTINASNPSADNPSTSDTPLLPIVTLGMLSGGLALIGWKRGWHNGKVKRK